MKFLGTTSSIDNALIEHLSLTLKSTVYDTVDFLWFEKLDANAELYGKYQAGKITGNQYIDASNINNATSLAQWLTGGAVAGLAYKRLGTDFLGQVVANGGFEVTYQIADIYGDQKVYEATGGQAGTNKQWSDFSLGQVALGAGIGAGLHFIPQIASGFKTMWTAQTAEHGLAARLVAPIAQTTQAAKQLLGSLADTTGLQILRKAGGVIKLGLKEIALPKALSMTSKQASEWLLKQVDVMKSYLDGLTVSLREKAAMAINLRNDFVAAARNAIYDTRVTKWLNEQSGLWIREEIFAQLGKTLSGDVLHKKIVELATSLKDIVIGGKNHRGLERECKFDGDCFVAGTLVHTDKGLVPIEQLKVGDMVLSRPENDPNAPNEYKRVVKTFKSEEKKRVVQIKFWDNDNNGQMSLFATEDHPFWVDEMGGWTPLKDFPRCEEASVAWVEARNPRQSCYAHRGFPTSTTRYHHVF